MVEVGRFVYGLKATGGEFLADETDDGSSRVHHFYSTNVVSPLEALNDLITELDQQTSTLSHFLDH